MLLKDAVTKTRACKLGIHIDKGNGTDGHFKAAIVMTKLQVVPTGAIVVSVTTGMTLQQAQVLSELFSGRAGLVASPAPCNMAQLQAYYSRSVMYTLACSVYRTTEQT